MRKLWIVSWHCTGEHSEWSSVLPTKADATIIHKENVARGFVAVKREHRFLAVDGGACLEPNECTIFSAQEFYKGG